MKYEMIRALLNRGEKPVCETLGYEDAVLLTTCAMELLKEARQIARINYECPEESQEVKANARKLHCLTDGAFYALKRREGRECMSETNLYKAMEHYLGGIEE